MVTEVNLRNMQVPNLAETAARVALTKPTNTEKLEGPKIYPTTFHGDLASNEQSNLSHELLLTGTTKFSQRNLESSDLDRIVESVENANKRLSLISTNTNSSKRKSKNHVGPWRLGRTLGRGSSGRVRLAKHSGTGQLAAVKIVPKAKFQKSSSRRDDMSPLGIEREIIIMKLISHQNIMALHDVWENKGELYLVLEYVEGGELFDYLVKKGRLEEGEAIRYFRQIISGVSYCHQFNICHRDLKPENLLLDKNQNIKIADFGMAALEMNQKLLETSCGSPHYASPEIVSGKTYHGSPSDVWSCGIILFALLTGHLPFDDDNIKILLTKVQTGNFTVPHYISPDAADLIRKMLVIDPEKRIKIFEVINHPLLKKYETPKSLKSSRNDKSKISQYYNKVEKMTLSRETIDTDILKSLSILFHGTTEAQLIPKLTSTVSNPEKIFYYLLQEYKDVNQGLQKKDISSRNINGLLKRSKSSVKTLLVAQNNTKIAPNSLIANYQNGVFPQKNKQSFRSPCGKLQIPASRSSQRNVSLNNRNIATFVYLGNAISQSSSNKSISNIITDPSLMRDKISHDRSKRVSLLPPLSSLDLSFNIEPTWTILENNSFMKATESYVGNSSMGSDLFAPLRTPPAIPLTPFQDYELNRKVKNSSPLKNKIAQAKSIVGSDETEVMKVSQNSDNGGEGVSKSAQTMSVSKRKSALYRTTSNIKMLTLDPKVKPRRISENNVKVLDRFGVKVKENRTSVSSYLKSSTLLDLNVLLESKETKAIVDVDVDVISIANRSLLSESKQIPPSLPLPIPPFDENQDDCITHKGRLTSSVYSTSTTHNRSGSCTHYSDASSCYSACHTTIDGADTYKEMPEKTSVAKMITVSNGSSVNVLKPFNKQDANLLILAEPLLTGDGTESEAAGDITERGGDLSLNTVVHRPIYNLINSSGSEHHTVSDLGTDTEFHNEILYSDSYSKFHQSSDTVGLKKSHSFEDGFDEVYDEDGNIICEDESFGELQKHKLVGLSVDQQFAEEHDAENDNKSISTEVPKLNVAMDKFAGPKPHWPSSNSKASKSSKKAENSTIKKSNWFNRFFSSLSTKDCSTPDVAQVKSGTGKKSINYSTKTYSSKIPLVVLKKGIKSALLLKQQEGLVGHFYEVNSEKLIARIPVQGFFSNKMVIFEIVYNFDKNSFQVSKTSGPQKWFKRVLKEVDFIVRYETQRFEEDEV